MEGDYEPTWFRTHEDGSISYCLPMDLAPPAPGIFGGCVEADGTVKSWFTNLKSHGMTIHADSFGAEASAEECRLVARWAEARGVKLPPLKPGWSREPADEGPEDPL